MLVRKTKFSGEKKTRRAKKFPRFIESRNKTKIGGSKKLDDKQFRR